MALSRVMNLLFDGNTLGTLSPHVYNAGWLAVRILVSLKTKSLFIARGVTALIGLSLLAACSMFNVSSTTYLAENQKTRTHFATASQSPADKAGLRFQVQAANNKSSIWDRLRRNYQLSGSKKNPEVQFYINQFSKSDYPYRLAERSAPYMHLLVEALEERNLPGELAFVPFIESNFNPNAISHKGAAGLWQMMPQTARRFGLTRDGKYDGRYDIAASTEAALDYLDYLGDMFEEDWLLALAAYNSGEGRVSNSIAYNSRSRQGTGFWALRLPRETKDYVPKILALAEIFANPRRYGLTLPAVQNAPYLTAVVVNKPLHLQEAAKLAGMSVQEVKQFNAAHHQGVAHTQGRSPLLLPVANARKFLERAENLNVRLLSMKQHPAKRQSSKNSLFDKVKGLLGRGSR